MFEERANRILREIEKKGTATIAELAQAAKTSQSTVRRDIDHLDKLGKLKRVYGGAARISNPVFTSEYDVATKSSINTDLKERIAAYAAKTIQSNDLVYLDAGTTTLMMIPHIKAPGAVFVTNGIAHARQLTQAGYKTFITAGELKLSTEAITGYDAVRSIGKYNFTKAFMGTNGVDAAFGFTTPDTDEAIVKEAVINRAYISYVLADSSKFKVVTSVTFASIEKACIITDRLTDESLSTLTVIKEVN